VVRHMHDSMKVLILSLLLVIVASTTFSVVAANRAADTSGQRAVCQILEINIDAYLESPPQTPLGKNLEAKYVQLYAQQCAQ
jgi:hypothetical protein